MELAIALAAFLWLSRSVANGALVFVKTPLNIPILSFIVLAAAQYAIGRLTSAKLGTAYPHGTKVYFFEVLSYMLAFLTVVNNFHSRRRINRLLFTVISVGSVLAVYGLIQKSAGATKIFWFKEVREVLLFYSSFINCNYYAGYMNIVLFLTLGAFFAYLAYLDKKKGYCRFSIFEGWNMLFLFMIAMMAVTIFHTFSQGGIVTLVATSVFFYTAYSKSGLSRKSILMGVLALVFALAAAALVWLWGDKVLDIFREAFRVLREMRSYGLRMPIWTRALNLAKLNPVSGTGLATFQYLFPKYQPNIFRYLPHCYNEYMELFIETGLIGFIIFSWGMLSFFGRYAKLLGTRHDSYVKAIGYGCLAAAFSVFINSFLDFNMHIGASALLFSVTLAIGSVVIHSSSHRNGTEETLFKSTTIALDTRSKKAIAFTVLSIAFLYTVINITAICMASAYASLGKSRRNVEYIKKAVRLQPRSAEYHYILAETLSDGSLSLKAVDKGVMGQAIHNLQKAVKLNRNVSKYHSRLGFMYSRAGDNEKALEELKKAEELEPFSAFNYLLLAIYYFNEATAIRGINPYGTKAMENGVLEYRKCLSINSSLTIGRYKKLLRDYPLIKEVLAKYSL